MRLLSLQFSVPSPPAIRFHRHVLPESWESLTQANMLCWLGMWLITGAIFLTGKLAALLAAKRPVSRWDQFAFVALWPGMNLREFTRPPTETLRLLPRGFGNLLIGAALAWGLARQLESRFLATWVAMVGFTWALHGGAFTLLTALWRRLGRDVKPLMNAPMLAASLADFWGRRWNRAFRDLSHQLIFKPAAPRWGARTAMLLVFFISGILHDLILTLPARGGYGLPTLYFSLQGIGMLIESRIPLHRTLTRRLLTFAFLLLPLPLGFPHAFVTRVADPFFTALGALP